MLIFQQLARCAVVVVCATGFLLPVSVRAVSLAHTNPDQMICGTQTARPDKQPGLVEQQLVTPSGNKIAYYRMGHGSPIVLITGYRATLSEWNSYFLGRLVQQHEVIVFDNRGIGRSAAKDGHYQAADLAQDTIDLIRGLHLQDVSLLGWSMGGMIAQQVATSSPTQISRLILLSTMAPGTLAVPTPAKLMQTLSSGSFSDIMAALFPPASVSQAKQCFSKDMFKPASYHAAEVSNAVSQQQRQLITDWQADQQEIAKLSALKIPTFVLTGTQDMTLSAQNSTALASHIPDASVKPINAGGHAMMYQFPLFLADRINTFIQRTSSTKLWR